MDQLFTWWDIWKLKALIFLMEDDFRGIRVFKFTFPSTPKLSRDVQKIADILILIDVAPNVLYYDAKHIGNTGVS